MEKNCKTCEHNYNDGYPGKHTLCYTCNSDYSNYEVSWL